MKEAVAPYRIPAVGRPPLKARPIAEVKQKKSTGEKRPRRKLQVVPRDGPVEGIFKALTQEIQKCVQGDEECGPCHMLRVGKVPSRVDAFRYELFSVMKYHNAPCYNQRLVSVSTRNGFSDLVNSHLLKMSGAVHPMRRAKVPGPWISMGGEEDVFTRY